MAAPAALFSKDSDVVVLEVFKSVASLSVSINYPKLGILSVSSFSSLSVSILFLYFSVSVSYLLSLIFFNYICFSYLVIIFS
jgi:hypothetical protein